MADTARETFSKESEYFLQKYGQQEAPTKQPRPERMCNMTGYHRKKKLEEFESKVFTGLEDVDRIVLIERHPCVSNSNQQAPVVPVVIVEKPKAKMVVQKAKPKFMRIVLNLKKEHLNLDRLEEMGDRFAITKLPDKSVRVEAVIPQSELPLFKKLFENLPLQVTAIH